MNKFVQKYVDDGVINETVGNYVDEALENGESIIVAGHRSSGTRPFMANMMAAAKSSYDAVQVKKEEQLEKEAEYYLIPGRPDLEDFVYAAIKKPNSSIVTIKEPESPLSIIKLLKKYKKEEGTTTDKVFHQVEFRKEDDTPYCYQITRFQMDESGKVKKEKLDF